MTTGPNSGLGAHCHHDTLFEFVWDYQKRLKVILEEKDPAERELREALFKLVPPELLPPALVEAITALTRAWIAYVSSRPLVAGPTYTRARSAFDNAIARLDQDALHKQVCHPNCPWDGNTIFAKGTSVDVLMDGGTA